VNIFKALSEGNGKISETNITSFLNYLLDSTNELNNSFFILFGKLIDENLQSTLIEDELKLDNTSIRNQIITFSESYVVSCEPEYAILSNNGSKVIPDILLKVSNKQSNEDVLYCIIENKIKKGAISKNQIGKQFRFFTESEEFTENIPIVSVYITPDEIVFESEFRKGKEENPNTVWLKWVNFTKQNNSIESVLKKLIKQEQNAEIQPIDLNTKFIIKSFIDYISSEFRKKSSGYKNFSYKGFDVVSTAKTDNENQTVQIRRYSNNMIRLFDSDDEPMNVQVKPILRAINENHNLGIELYHSTGKSKNTQILGREIINKLNSKNN